MGKVYPRIFRQVNRVQRKWAKWMDRRYNGLSVKKKKLLLLTFCIMWLSALCFLSTEAILLPASNRMMDSKINMPRLEIPPIHQGPGLPKKTLDRIAAFRSAMDSLGHTEAGRKTRDSILQARPGLLDSIAAIDRIYQLSENK